MVSNQLNLQDKLNLVYDVSEQSEQAHKVLSSMTRVELGEILCAETGLKRKYAGYTKCKLIDRLLKVVNNKFKKKNKSISKVTVRLYQEITNSSSSSAVVEQSSICPNLACKSELAYHDQFCNRCDDNKDPSLWLICECVTPYDGQSCGISCHLVCALGNERKRKRTNGGSLIKLEKGFQCVSCGKNNGLMRCLHRQLLAAKEARRVHTLSLHLKLSRELVDGTEQYRELQKTVQTAAGILENEVGLLQEAHREMDCQIVGRLACAADVQKLSLSALGMFHSLPIETRSNRLNPKERAACQISFEELSPTSVTVILDYEERLLEGFLDCRLWHRKSSSKDYHKDATFVVLKPEKRFKLSGLDPSTKYFCKVSFFSDNGTLGIWEAKWVTPASRSSESCLSILEEPKGDNERGLSETYPEKTSNDHEKDKIVDESLVALSLISSKVSPSISSLHTFTHTESNSTMDGCKKHVNENDYDYCVRMVRWMEKEGHVDPDFRVKFLTWFSLKATVRERRVVNVFVDTLVEDPPSLVAQLLDGFSYEIFEKPLKPGFCSRLCH